RAQRLVSSSLVVSANYRFAYDSTGRVCVRSSKLAKFAKQYPCPADWRQVRALALEMPIKMATAHRLMGDRNAIRSRRPLRSPAPASHYARAWNVASRALSEIHPLQKAGVGLGLSPTFNPPTPFL